MINASHTFLFLPAFALVTTSAQAGTILSETFSGSESTDLVGTTTPDGNNWTGATVGQDEPAVDATEQDESTDGAPATKEPKFTVKQDGSTGGISFSAYHKFTLKQGQVYTLEAVLSPANKFDNQWFTVGFAATAGDGDDAPHLDGCTTYGQTVLSGSGYRYGWTGPDTRDMCELHGPDLHIGSVKVVLNTSNPSEYTIELFDGEGESIHGPKSIGTSAITQVFIGSSGTDGAFTSLKLSDDSNPEPETETETETEE